jgi:uncharacterized protein Yka (UPF0111/DUF47 family)
MLRDDAVVALDEVVLACREAAQAYRDAAGLVDGPSSPPPPSLPSHDIAELFAELADERTRMAEELESHIRSMGDVLSEPDLEQYQHRVAVAQERLAHARAAATARIDC